MPQFFLSKDSIDNNRGFIKGTDYHHLLSVRRIKKGDSLQCRDEKGTLFSGRVIDITEESIVLDLHVEKKNSNVQVALHLYMALLKGKNFDLALQKAVEVGVTSITPVISERTIPKIDQKAEKLLERWNRIALEASKQSLRETVAVVNGAEMFSDVLCALKDDQCGILGHPEASLVDRNFFLSLYDEYNLLVGPEGGFSKNEISLAEKRGWHILSFGTNHLRAETAAIVLPALILHEVRK